VIIGIAMDDRHYRIFVVFSYKVFERWALVSHTEVNHVPKAYCMGMFSWWTACMAWSKTLLEKHKNYIETWFLLNFCSSKN